MSGGQIGQPLEWSLGALCHQNFFLVGIFIGTELHEQIAFQDAVRDPQETVRRNLRRLFIKFDSNGQIIRASRFEITDLQFHVGLWALDIGRP